MKAGMKLARPFVVLVAVSAVALLCAARPAPAGVNVGDKVAISFKAVDGTPVSIDKLKGRIVVVDFWATWCGPCMAMADEMVDIHKTYHDKGLQMVGISLDHNRG